MCRATNGAVPSSVSKRRPLTATTSLLRRRWQKRGSGDRKSGAVRTVVCIWCRACLLSRMLCGWCCGCWSRYSLPRGAKRRMGNQVARVGNASHKKAESATAMGAGNGSHGTSIATAAAAAVVSKSEPEHHNSHTQFFPIESLAKVQRLARLFKNVLGISTENRMSWYPLKNCLGKNVEAIQYSLLPNISTVWENCKNSLLSPGFLGLFSYIDVLLSALRLADVISCSSCNVFEYFYHNFLNISKILNHIFFFLSII